MPRHWLAFLIFAIGVTTAFGAASAAEADGGIISEVRLGVLAHEAGIMTNQVEPLVADVNFEILFDSPEAFAFFWSPRPHLGATVNPAGDTSNAYLGLTWDWSLTERVFVEASAGGAVHNGRLDKSPAAPDEKALGCRLLFRGALAIGYRLTDHQNLSVMADHLSNAYLCDENPGLDTVGLRWGYRF